MTIEKKLFIGVLSIAFLFNACKKDDDDPVDTTISLSEIVNAYGGQTAIDDVNYITYKVEGTAFEFREAPEPQGNLVTNYTFDLTASLTAEEIEQAWSMSVIYAFNFSLNFTDVIVGNTGVVKGGPNTFASYAFGSFGQPIDPMGSIKLAGRKKIFFMSSPIAILKQLVAENATVSSNNTLTTMYEGQKIVVTVNPSSKLFTIVSTDEHDPVYGDVTYEVAFSNWVTTGGIQYPAKMTHTLKDEIIRNENISEISMSSSVSSDKFDFGGLTATPYDESLAAKGRLSSQYYLRMFVIGFPFDEMDEQAIDASFINANNEVLVIKGTEHYSYAFKVGNEVILYDASQTNARQLAVLGAVNQNFPGLSVKAVVLSHNHFDHSGGLRGALSSGGDLIVGQGSVSDWTQILNRSHTLENNPLTGTVNVVGVSDVITYGSGSEMIEIYVTETIHSESEDMLIIYKPSIQTIFYADLYNGGFVNIIGFFPNLATTIKERAQQLINFVDAKGLNVQFIAPVHGDLNDNTYQSVITAAQ